MLYFYSSKLHLQLVRVHKLCNFTFIYFFFSISYPQQEFSYHGLLQFASILHHCLLKLTGNIGQGHYLD